MGGPKTGVRGLLSIALLRRYGWHGSRKVARKQYRRAKQLMSSSREPDDIYSALGLLDIALKLYPQWEKALELKARALLYLRRFKDVANMLRDFIPSHQSSSATASMVNHPTVCFDSESCPYTDRRKLVSDQRVPACRMSKFWSFSAIKCCFCSCFSRKIISGGKPLLRLSASATSGRLAAEKGAGKWRYVVLGEACCHLGMMEDAMILLQKGRKVASVDHQKRSKRLREDGFNDAVNADQSSLIAHLLGNIKFLLRRRTAAMAALEAGHYSESIRHFSKIVEGRRRIPQGFAAECYMQRAAAFRGAGRYTEAIVDCNRTLALNPSCTEALNARASLFELVRCLPECLQDLEQLKALYESFRLRRLHKRPVSGYLSSSGGLHSTDNLQTSIDYVRSKIVSLRQRQAMECRPNYHMILGVPRDCSRTDAERAYLIFFLRHNPDLQDRADRVVGFVDRCELVDGRGIESVKGEARCSALQLFRLIQKSYSSVLSLIAEEQARLEQRIQYCNPHHMQIITNPSSSSSLNHYNNTTSHQITLI